MGQHPGTEKGLENLLARRVPSVVTSAPLGQAILGEALVGLGQPLGPGGIVGQEEPEQDGAQQGDDALDDEQPAERLQSAGAVDVADPVGDGAAERAGQVAEGDDAGDADAALVEAVPDGDEVDDPFLVGGQTTRVCQTCGGENDIPGKKPASKTPIRKRRATTLA